MAIAALLFMIFPQRFQEDTWVFLRDLQTAFFLINSLLRSWRQFVSLFCFNIVQHSGCVPRHEALRLAVRHSVLCIKFNDLLEGQFSSYVLLLTVSDL